MNILTLSIKQKYFDEILAGKKTHEYREIRPTNAKKYITYLCGGKEYPADAYGQCLQIGWNFVPRATGYVCIEAKLVKGKKTFATGDDSLFAVSLNTKGIRAAFVFAPSVEEMYPEPDTRRFSYAPLDTVMEGAFPARGP